MAELFMNSRKPISRDADRNFKSVVDTLKVSSLERRIELAETINHARLKILELLNLPHSLAGRGDWSLVQKRIHEELQSISDIATRNEVNRFRDQLLDAEAELVEGNLRLVLMVVRRYTRGATGALEEMDFVQEGCEGLLDAVRRFDFSGSTGFLSYALIRIRKKVLLALEKQPRLVRVPAHVIRKGRFLREIIDGFIHTYGRYPHPDEIEAETGGEMDWSILLSLTENVHSIHYPVGNSGIALEEQLASLENTSGFSTLSELVEEGLARLDLRAKFILIMRYGLLDGDPQTLSKIADVLGLSTERIRQIEKESIKILRHNFGNFSAGDWLH